MKSAFVTLVILALLFIGYDAFLAPPPERMIFGDSPRPSPPAKVEEAVKREQPVVSAETEPAWPSPKPKAQPAAVETAPPMPVSAEPAPVVVAEFQPPHFDSIEVLTGGWQKIPPSAFGRSVKLTKPVSFKLSFGESKVPAGRSVVAMGVQNGWLVVAPAAESSARGYIAMDDCDFKAQLAETYEKWKAARVAALKQAFEGRKQSATSVASSSDRASPPADPSGKPVQAADGSYPLLLAKLRSGEPAEITPKNITRWGSVEQTKLNGVPTWTIDVTYDAPTLFGMQSAETSARVQNGKVVAWIYKGSGEPVP